MVGNVLRVRYELTQLLHEGPIFTAYAARDRLQGREVCVRILRPPFGSEPDFVAKIREVVQQFSAIQHPGIEAMLEVDEDEGKPFLISELTKGTTLAERIRKLAPFSVPVAVSTGISLCEALEALHGAGLAHGDVSAVNIASLPDGQVTLQVPGMWQAYAVSPMAAGIALPSMSPYLAPEISAGGLPSPAGDVYAAGVVLYELLTGRLPYNADTPVSMALKHATGTVPSVRMYNPSVPAVLDEIVKKALSKDPASRYPSAGSLLADLRVLQDALRFGRTITWPIHPDGTTPPNAMPKSTAPRVETNRATPRPKAEREPADVPIFLVVPIIALVAVVATLLGVFFFFNLSKPPLAKVPNLAGLTLAEAKEMVKPSKLGVEIATQKSSETVPADHIIASDPPAGEHVREGSRIRVTISTGSRLVRVPDLRGNSRDQAVAMLDSAHLQLDDNVETQPSDKVDSGLIISQSPKAGARVDQTTKIHVVVSSGGAGNQDDNPDNPPAANGNVNLYTLRVKLSRIEKPVTLRVDIIDDLGTRTVYEEEQDPEETVELATRGTGKMVTFKIYYDNELVKTVTQSAAEGSPVPPDGDSGQ